MSETSTNSVFSYRLNAESRLYIETINDRDKSIFGGVYNSFFSELKKMLPEMANEKSTEAIRNVFNNIFAFVGDRGAGKTSCMLSVANMLAENENLDDSDTRKLNKSFKILESTDPSFFDESTNILDIFLGRLFSEFSNEWNNGDKERFGEKNELLAAFEKVKGSVSRISRKKKGDFLCEDDNVEKLINLSDSTNLEKDIEDLVKKFLKFFRRDILVVPIDDIDLHSACAFEMVEEIRKYLVQKNIIILMALRIEQLDKVAEKNYIYEFQELIKNNMLSVDDVAGMANKYLIKLIPYNHRFFLPELNLLYDRTVEIQKLVNDKWENVKYDSPYFKYSGYPARYLITKLIFSKTRYLFYHMNGATSMIVPQTLREYTHLLALLLNMEDYQEITSHKEKGNNKALFKSYFIQSWCRSNLKESDSAFVKQLFSTYDPSIINKMVVEYLKEKFNLQKRFAPSTNKLLSSVCNDSNFTYNISIGDINYLIRKIKGTLYKNEDKAFVFAIETFYSIRLYEYYDLRTEENLQRARNKIEQKVLVQSILDEFSPYEIFIGGSVYTFKNYKKGCFLPIEKSTQKSREHRTISLMNIRNVFARYLDDHDYSKLRLVEFFALFLLRKNFSKFRQRRNVVYAEKFANNQEAVFFDILAFFSNLVNVKRCYNRIDERIYTEATKDGVPSLYNNLRNYCIKARSHATDSENIKDHALLSYCSIRNIEILNDFCEKMNQQKYIFESSDNRTCLIQFFKNIMGGAERNSGYTICSYDNKEDNNTWNTIDFNFVEEFINVLKDDSIKFSFDEIFKYKQNESEDFDEDFDEDLQDDDSIDETLEKDKKLREALEKDKKLREALEKDKKLREALKNNPSWEINEDLHNAFEKTKFYETKEVRVLVRKVLQKKKISHHKISSWLSRKYRSHNGDWKFYDIDNLISKFIDYILSICEKSND